MDTCRILLVEHDAALRLALVAWMEREPEFECVAAAETEAAAVAAAVALGRHGGVDLLLVALDLPDTDGIGLIRQLRRLLPAARVIALTGHDVDAVAPALDELRVHQQMPKGASPEQLFMRLRMMR